MNGAPGIGGIMGGGGGGGGGGYGTSGFSYAAGALTAAYSTVNLTVNAADARSAEVPDACLLSALDLAFDTIAAAAVALNEVYISEDALGYYPLSHPVDVTWVLSRTAAHFVASIQINRVYFRSAVGTAGIVYLQWQTTVGTCNGVARLRWTE